MSGMTGVGADQAAIEALQAPRRGEPN
jgi:hypothetical protein